MIITIPSIELDLSAGVVVNDPCATGDSPAEIDIDSRDVVIPELDIEYDVLDWDYNPDGATWVKISVDKKDIKIEGLNFTIEKPENKTSYILIDVECSSISVCGIEVQEDDVNFEMYLQYLALKEYFGD